MDDVILPHNPRLIDVAAQLKRSTHGRLSNFPGGNTADYVYYYNCYH